MLRVVKCYIIFMIKSKVRRNFVLRVVHPYKLVIYLISFEHSLFKHLANICILRGTLFVLNFKGSTCASWWSLIEFQEQGETFNNWRGLLQFVILQEMLALKKQTKSNRR